jgi:uncharacterized cupin superfamily protein
VASHDHVIHTQELAWSLETAPDGSAPRERKKLAAAAGGRELGASLYRMGPGAKPWPRHAHLANEEAIFVLAGEGELRVGERSIPLRTGDYVALPAGLASAHQIRNPSQAELVFLCVSTMREPDIIVYPDSQKVGLFAGAAPGGSPQQLTLRKFLALGGEVDFWQGE